MKYISLTVPNPNVGGQPLEVKTPPGVPDTGLFAGQTLLQIGITGMFVIASILVLVMIIYSGIRWIMSGGDPKAIEGARNRLVYSLVGFIIIVGSFAIVSLFIQILGGNPAFFLPQS